MTPDLDVLIAGAGPVGLFLANECARRGVRFRIIETRAGQSTHSKALAIFPRTFEVFDMAGVAEPFLQAANRVTRIEFVSHQRSLGEIDFTPEGTPHPYVAMVPQDVTERILVDRLNARGAAVEYQTTLTSAGQTGDFVNAVVERDGVSETVRAAFLVGCDGAHSLVRQTLGLQFEGGDYPEQYMLADVHMSASLAPGEMQLCPSEDGPLAIFPITAERKRLVATVDDADGDAPSLAQINGVLKQRGPDGFVAESIVWSSYFKIHHRCVSQMSDGRMFVAGDAAHIHSPFGGQGMNTGLQDAWNLAWKLDFTVRGIATQRLLDSYSAERYPVIKGVIETTHMLTEGLGSRNRIVEGIRDTMIPIVTHVPAFQHIFINRLSGLGNAYGGSPVVEGSGERYFDESLCGGTFGRRFLLAIPSGDSGTMQAAAKLVDRFPDALEIHSSADPRLLLVRPDGYLAYEAAHADASEMAAVEEVLGRQLKPVGAP